MKVIDGNFGATILADSYVRVPKNLNPDGYHRITTFEVDFARIVLAEFNTHRLFSRNSASSRAIPVERMIESVEKNPFVPNRFPRTHKGMQAASDNWVEEGDKDYQHWTQEWLQARDEAVCIAKRLLGLGVSKQLTNRFLEPVLMHKVIVTSTEWDNFFSLRANEEAQNEIKILAEIMLEAYNESQPVELQGGEWHVPFGSLLQDFSVEDQLKIAIARCARISYKTFDGTNDPAADLKLFERLSTNGHWSPFEHVARAMSPDRYEQFSQRTPDLVEYGWCGNFRGFEQYRRMFPRTVENRPDPRVKKLIVS